MSTESIQMKSSFCVRPIDVLTHRGLEPSNNNFYSESTIESFLSHLERGFGLEVDLNFTRDGIVFCHDATFKRLTNGQDERALKQLTTDEACGVLLPNGRLGSIEELMDELKKYPDQLVALHFKGSYQNYENSLILLEHLRSYEDLLDRVFVFDATLTIAKLLKKSHPSIQLMASVAHPYDIERYQEAAKGTLLSLESLLENKDVYSGAWLDEWDLADRASEGIIDSKGKKLYTAEVFQFLRAHGFKIGLVTPELHGTSPGLLGGEAHPDAQSQQRLFERIQEIIALQPDVICTDYPEEVKALISKQGCE